MSEKPCKHKKVEQHVDDRFERDVLVRSTIEDVCTSCGVVLREYENPEPQADIPPYKSR